MFSNDEVLNVGVEHEVRGERDEEVTTHSLSTRYRVSTLSGATHARGIQVSEEL